MGRGSITHAAKTWRGGTAAAWSARRLKSQGEGMRGWERQRVETGVVGGGAEHWNQI